MFSTIIGKEILDNFLNKRFVGACVVSIILVLSTIVVLAASYEEELRDYQGRVVEQDRFVDQFGHWNRANWMTRAMRMPSHFRALVLGIDREAQQKNFVSNPVPALLSRLDLVTIVTIIMSLMAILFSFDSLSGEREAGILRLMLSTSVSRSTIVLGKFLGGVVSLLIPFTIGVLVGLLYLVATSKIQMTGTDTGIFFLLLGASWLYISAFFGLGMLLSSRSRTSGQAVLKALFAWVVLVLFIPNISPFLAAEVFTIPSAAKVEKERTRITSDERDRIIAERGRALLRARYPDLTEIVNGTRAKIDERLQGNPALRERYSQYVREYDDLVTQVNLEQGEKERKFAKAFEQRSKQQEDLATMFASISPVSGFIFIATDATETGIAGDDQWNAQADAFDGALGTYAKTKYQKEKEKNPAFDYNDYIDMRDRPRFQYRPEGLAERTGSVLPQLGLLAAFNLLFLALTFVSFLRYDVR